MQTQLDLLSVLSSINTDHAFLIVDADFNLVSFNHTAEIIFQLDFQNLNKIELLKKIRDIFPVKSWEDLKEGNSFLKKITEPPEYWVVTWFHFDQEEKDYFLISFKGITEIVQKISFTSAQELESRYRFLFDNVPVPLWQEDFSQFKAYLENLKSEGYEDLQAYFLENPDEIAKFFSLVKISDVNQSGIEINQVTKEQLIGPLASSFLTQSREMILEEILALIRGETRFDGETSKVTLDGQRLDMRVQYRIPEQFKDSWKQVLVSTQDITQSKKTERVLREVVAQNTQLMKAITSILIQIDSQYRVVHWNQKASDVLGLHTEDVIHFSIKDCQIPWDQKRVLNALHQCEVYHTQVRLDDVFFNRKSGGDGYLGITINPILDQDSNLFMGFLILGADITDRKVLEAQLLQAQKLESIGQLAAGIAHEINTPTQYIGDNIRFLKESFEDLFKAYRAAVGLISTSLSSPEQFLRIAEETGQVFEEVDLEYLIEEIPMAIDQSLEGIERVSTIVKAMKEFSHPGATEKTPIDINHAIENTLTVARNEWKYVAEVERQYEPNLPLIPCLPGEFNQVILNLITNAAHAIEKATKDHPGDLGRITIHTENIGEFVEIRISDTGTGIPEDVRNKVFDPFFTTKEVGKGTGQGLTIAYNVIVEKHGGNLTFNTEVGKGTTFIIQLPIQVEGL